MGRPTVERHVTENKKTVERYLDGFNKCRRWNWIGLRLHPLAPTNSGSPKASTAPRDDGARGEDGRSAERHTEGRRALRPMNRTGHAEQ